MKWNNPNVTITEGLKKQLAGVQERMGQTIGESNNPTKYRVEKCAHKQCDCGTWEFAIWFYFIDLRYVKKGHKDHLYIVYK